VTTVRFNEPYISGNELKYIEDVFKERRFYGVGKYTEKCEAFIKDRLGAQCVLLTDSCTSALEMAALLLKDEARREIILPSYTFSSTGSAFLRAGFDLVFAEIDPRTLMIDLDDVKAKVTDRTQAVVTVHYGGLPSSVVELRELCDQGQIYLVEDAAQAFDCSWRGKALGTIGDFRTFTPADSTTSAVSFHPLRCTPLWGRE
jgi:dTDP-4-amino-4,6-dideoxygalactose transaminase